MQLPSVSKQIGQFHVCVYVYIILLYILQKSKIVLPFLIPFICFVCLISHCLLVNILFTEFYVISYTQYRVRFLLHTNHSKTIIFKIKMAFSFKPFLFFPLSLLGLFPTKLYNLLFVWGYINFAMYLKQYFQVNSKMTQPYIYTCTHSPSKIISSRLTHSTEQVLYVPVQ